MPQQHTTPTVANGDMRTTPVRDAYPLSVFTPEALGACTLVQLVHLAADALKLASEVLACNALAQHPRGLAANVELTTLVQLAERVALDAACTLPVVPDDVQRQHSSPGDALGTMAALAQAHTHARCEALGQADNDTLAMQPHVYMANVPKLEDTLGYALAQAVVGYDRMPAGMPDLALQYDTMRPHKCYTGHHVVQATQVQEMARQCYTLAHETGLDDNMNTAYTLLELGQHSRSQAYNCGKYENPSNMAGNASGQNMAWLLHSLAMAGWSMCEDQEVTADEHGDTRTLALRYGKRVLFLSDSGHVQCTRYRSVKHAISVCDAIQAANDRAAADNA